MSAAVTGKMILPKAEWSSLYRKMQDAVPEAFDSSGNLLNLMEGEWKNAGYPKSFLSPVDGRMLGAYPRIDLEACKKAVDFAAKEFADWKRVSLEDRKAKTLAAVEEMEQHRELLAYLLVWEIGKPYKQALKGVDRCFEGVRWYLDNIDPMMEGREPIGLISNIASWNYPLSVLMHACLIHSLAGNTVIAKTPSDGGLFALTVCNAIARRHGLPMSLVSGSGGQLSEALVRNENIACLAYVGGKSNGKRIAASLYDANKRYMLEMEGVNAYGIWEYSDWEDLAAQIKKGFAYGKQRCTAYVRWVIQRELFPQFLEMYIPVLKSLKFGNPLLVDSAEDEAPDLDFGPLINSAKAEEVDVLFSDAVGKGSIPIFRAKFDSSMFLPNQDISAYSPPTAIMNVPKSANVYHNEPFGPLDSILLVDRLDELTAEMNISNGSLVSSVATDNEEVAKEVASSIRSYKFGVNKMRSRGDREETFGGVGESWKGCFVGGKYLVESVTEATSGNARLYGNFPDYTLMPESR